MNCFAEGVQIAGTVRTQMKSDAMNRLPAVFLLMVFSASSFMNLRAAVKTFKAFTRCWFFHVWNWTDEVPTTEVGLLQGSCVLSQNTSLCSLPRLQPRSRLLYPLSFNTTTRGWYGSFLYDMLDCVRFVGLCEVCWVKSSFQHKQRKHKHIHEAKSCGPVGVLL